MKLELKKYKIDAFPRTLEQAQIDQRDYDLEQIKPVVDELEAKVTALEDAHYELALSTNKIIRELNAQIETLGAKLPTKEEAEEIEIAIVNSDNPPSVDTIVAILAKLRAIVEGA